MAVDTKVQRFSMMNFGDGDALLPGPDGSIGIGDRFHLLGLYSSQAVGVVLKDVRIDLPKLSDVEVRSP